MFPNFLTFYVLSRLTNREVTLYFVVLDIKFRLTGG